MSDGVNKAILVGNLGADGELRFTGGGGAVLNLRLATTTSYYNKAKEERVENTEWHAVVVWGPRGEALSKIINKGDRLYVEGEIRTREYEKDGVKKYSTEVHASEVVLCGGGKSSGDTKSESKGDSRGRDDDRRGDDRGRGRDDDRGRGRESERGSGRRDDRRDERGGRSDERGSGGGSRREAWE